MPERQQHHTRYVEPGAVPDARLVAAARGERQHDPAATSTAYTSRQEPTFARPAESSGPSAIPAPTLAPQTPVAWARSCGSGKVAAIMPRPAAIIAAAADALHHAGDHEGDHLGRRPRRAGIRPRGPAAPATKVRRRPKSSATRPAVSRNAPRPMLIELRIQVRPEVPAPRPATVRFTVASGAVKATSVTRVPSEAVTRVRRAAVTGAPVWSDDRTRRTIACSLVTRPDWNGDLHAPRHRLRPAGLLARALARGRRRALDAADPARLLPRAYAASPTSRPTSTSRRPCSRPGSTRSSPTAC